MELTPILGICVVAAVLATLLRQYKGEYAVMLVAVASAAVIISVLWSAIDAVFTLRNLVVKTGVDTTYFTTAFKALGICVITGFASDLCRDMGQQTLASGAELAGRCAVFIISVPMLVSLLQTALKLIG